MILNYKNYIQHIKEGLITTHNIQIHYMSLDIELNSIGIKHELNIISKFKYDLTILNPKELTLEKLEYCIKINQNLLGYFPSYIQLYNDFGKNSFKFDEKWLDTKWNKIIIRFEAKYEDGLYKNDLEVPEFAYHLSQMKNLDKIIKNGLIPKSNNRKTSHPERIYFFYDIEKLNDILKSLKFNDELEGKKCIYCLFKVKFTDKNIIHTDPNYQFGFYTNDNISPKNVEVLKQK